MTRSPTTPPPGWSSTAGTTSRLSTGLSNWPRCPSSGPSSSACGTRGRAPSSASACAPTWRCAAWPPAGCWPHSNYGAGGWESATVRMLPTGSVQVVTGSSPHGQGHETTWSQIVADQLGIDPNDDRGAALRHRGLGPRSRHLRLPVPGRRRHGCPHGDRHRPREGPLHRRPPAGGVGRRPRVRGGLVPGPGLSGQVDGHRRRGDGGLHRPRPARRHGAQPDGAGHLRPAELRLPVRHPRGGHRIGHRDRRHPAAGLHRGRRLREPDQPDDRRGPGPRWDPPRRRPGPVGGGRLRRRRATSPTCRWPTTSCPRRWRRLRTRWTTRSRRARPIPSG